MAESNIGRRKFLRLSGKRLLQLGVALPAALAVKSLITARAGASTLDDISTDVVDAPPILTSQILMYHEVTAARLRSDLLSLIAAGYQPMSMEALVGFFNGTVNIPVGLPTFMVTCDDSLQSQYRATLDTVNYVHARTGHFVPFTFFAISKFNNPDRPISDIPGNTPAYNDHVHSYMTRDQLVDLIRRGHRVDNHTVDHANLTVLPEGARNAEVEDGERRIQALWNMAGVNRQIKAFAYPYGRYTGQDAYIASLGYDAAFTELKSITSDYTKRFILGRVEKS